MGKGKGGKKSGETAIDVEIIPPPPPPGRGPKEPTKQTVQGGSSGPKPVDPASRPKKDPTGTM